MALQKCSMELINQIQKLLKKSGGYRVTTRWIYYSLVAQRVIHAGESSYRNIHRICSIVRNEGLLDKEVLVPIAR